MVLFADDTSLLITGYNKLDFNININQLLHSIIVIYSHRTLIKPTMWNLEPKIITRLKLYLDMNRKIFPISQRLNFWD
jgi:hypothetical protein